MRGLIWIAVTLAVIWSAYWATGTYFLRNAIDQWFADQSASGITAEKSSLTLTGFPNRFDIIAEGIRIADPQTGFGWESPAARVYVMTWKPWHIITDLAAEQTIRLPDQDIGLVAQGLRASARARPRTTLPLANITVESGPFTATSTAGWTIGGQSLNFTIAEEPAADATYRIGLRVTDLAPDPAVIAALGETSTLPPIAEIIEADITARLSAPLDRTAAETNPRLIRLDVSDIEMTWGTLAINASGLIEPDATGHASGRVMIEVTNWRELVPLLVATGTVTPKVAPTVENMLTALANDSGNPTVLKLPLIFENGRMSLAFLPLGPAPLLVPPTN